MSIAPLVAAAACAALSPLTASPDEDAIAPKVPIGFHNGENEWDPNLAGLEVGVLRVGVAYDPGAEDEAVHDPELVQQVLARDIRLWVTLSLHGGVAPADEDGFRRWVRRLVERYDGDGVDDDPSGLAVHYYQLANELGLEWKGTWPEYARTLRWVHDEVRAANPRARVAIAGARAGDSSARLYTEEVLPAIRAEMDASGGPQPFELFDQHNIHVGMYRPRYEFLDRFLDRVRAALAELSFEADFVVTETSSWSGSITKAGRDHVQSEEDQAIELVKRLVFPLTRDCEFAMWSRVTERDVWFGPRREKGTEAIFTNAAVVNNPANKQSDDGDEVPDDHKKLAYFTYRLLAERLRGVDSAGVSEVTPEGFEGRVVRVASDEAPWWIVWRDGEEDGRSRTALALPEGFARARVTEAVAEAPHGKGIVDDASYVGRFRSRVAPAGPTGVVVSVGRRPLLVEPLE